jgi:putative transposase
MRAQQVNDKRIDDATGERRRFGSAILPPWCGKSPKINEVLPLLYPHGLSGQDFAPALEGFLGTGSGPSAAERRCLLVYVAVRVDGTKEAPRPRRRLPG